MALVTTPGAANADSYAELADANAYFTARGVTTWTGTDEVKEAALRRGTAYLDNQYRNRWIGVRTNELQSLAWPRCMAESFRTSIGFTTALFDTDGFPIGENVVPTQVKNAAIEAALLAITGATLEPTLARGGMIKSIGKSVGPLRKDITYMDGASAVDRYIAIEGHLRGLVKSTPGATSGMVDMVRS